MINKENYFRDGYISPIDILSPEETLTHRKKLETAEKKIGSLHYKTQVHTILKSPYELAINKKVLNIVEDLIGPNILLYNVTYIIKEPNTSSHVSWHQDLTYWGFNNDNVVSMWLALSEANELSGAMEIIPGSHNLGVFDHENLIYQFRCYQMLRTFFLSQVHFKLDVNCARIFFHHFFKLEYAFDSGSVLKQCCDIISADIS